MTRIILCKWSTNLKELNTNQRFCELTGKKVAGDDNLCMEESTSAVGNKDLILCDKLEDNSAVYTDTLNQDTTLEKFRRRECSHQLLFPINR